MFLLKPPSHSGVQIGVPNFEIFCSFSIFFSPPALHQCSEYARKLHHFVEQNNYMSLMNQYMGNI
jgi:hypothetical protein